MVGTGGKSQYACGAVVRSLLCLDTQFGALRLVLGSDGFTWSFRAVDGTVSDSGAGRTR